MNSGQRPPQDVFSWGGAAYLSRWVLADVRADMTMRMLSVSHMITAAAWRCPTANHRLVKIPRWLTASGKHLALSRALIGAGVPLQVNAVFQPHLIFLCFCPLISELQCFFLVVVDPGSQEHVAGCLDRPHLAYSGLWWMYPLWHHALWSLRFSLI